MQGKYIAISVLGMFLSFSAAAQTAASKDTVIRGATIEIIQSYKPEVTRPPRPEPAPSLPPIDTTTPRLQYNTPPQTLFYSYGSLPLRPLALDISKEEQGYDSYVKLGGGNLSTILLDAGTAALKGDNYETSIRLHHLSQAGKISDQKASSTGLDASGTYHTDSKKAIGVQFGVSNDAYRYYGYDHAIYNYPESAVKQAFTTISLGVDLEDELAEGKLFNYHPTINFYTLGDKFNTTETTIGIRTPVSYDIDSNLQIYASINATVTNLTRVNTSGSNNIFQFAPGIRFTKGLFTGHAGISPTLGETNPVNTKSTYFLPDVEVSFNLPETQFIFNAGWQGKLVQNSFRELSTVNPFMVYRYFDNPQTETSEVFAGIKSNIGEHITFNGRFSWWQYNSLPLFINDTANDKRHLLLIYDNKVNAIGLQAAIRYHVAQTFSIGFDAQWMNFYNKTYTQLWHVPGVRLRGDIQAQPMKKLNINAYISFLDELYALDNNNRTLKLSSILDIGAEAEYEVIDRVNIFLRANNLLNSRYERWYGYDAFGFNILGGARLKF